MQKTNFPYSYPSLSSLKTHLLSGKPLLIYDGSEREGEVDLVFYPKSITPSDIHFLRTFGGGLICLAVSKEISDLFSLPFSSSLLPSELSSLKISRTPYGDPSSFSISINHRSTYTGITDKDRAKTITSFFSIAENRDRSAFLSEFYSPGHVFLLRSSSLKERKGHTELSTHLFSKLSLTPVALLCEMLDSNGKALSPEKARRFSSVRGFPFISSDYLTSLLSPVSENVKVIH